MPRSNRAVCFDFSHSYEICYVYFLNVISRLVPAKLYREWKDLFLCGLPLYEVEEAELSPEELEKEREIAAEKERLLDEGDFMEYKVSPSLMHLILNGRSFCYPFPFLSVCL